MHFGDVGYNDDSVCLLCHLSSGSNPENRRGYPNHGLGIMYV